MTPAILAELILKIGLPAAEHLFQLYKDGNKPVTAEDWLRLKELSTYSSAQALENASH